MAEDANVIFVRIKILNDFDGLDLEPKLNTVVKKNEKS